MKFNKPFSTFYIKYGSLKEAWANALIDPGYLFLWIILLSLLIYLL